MDMKKLWCAALALGFTACSTQATPTANSATPVPEMAANESSAAPSSTPAPPSTGAAAPSSAASPSSAEVLAGAAPPSSGSPSAAASGAPAAGASAKLNAAPDKPGALVQCLDVRAALVRCKEGEKLSHAGCAGPDYMMRCQP